MNLSRKAWTVGWRLALCALLMLWVFHAIFTQEGRDWTLRQGGDWDALGRTEQWRMAWQRGPLELWQTMRLLEPGAALVSLLAMGLTVLLGVVRWRLVMRGLGLELSFMRAAEISLVAHFFNSFLLGSTGGDLLKAYYAARETHHQKAEAVVTVFVDRLIGLFAMLLFAGVMMLPNLGLVAGHGRISALALLILGMLAGCSLVAALAFWGGLSRPWPQARGWLRRLPKGELLERCLEACRRLGRDRMLLARALGISLALNAAAVFQIWALVRGLGLNVSPVVLLVIVPMIICVAALPITPSGLGVRENLYVLLLSVPAIQIPPTLALSVSLLAYAGSLCWSLVGGVGYAFLRESQQLAAVTQPPRSSGDDDT